MGKQFVQVIVLVLILLAVVGCDHEPTAPRRLTIPPGEGCPPNVDCTR